MLAAAALHCACAAGKPQRPPVIDVHLHLSPHFPPLLGKMPDPVTGAAQKAVDETSLREGLSRAMAGSRLRKAPSVRLGRTGVARRTTTRGRQHTQRKLPDRCTETRHPARQRRSLSSAARSIGTSSRQHTPRPAAHAMRAGGSRDGPREVRLAHCAERRRPRSDPAAARTPVRRNLRLRKARRRARPGGRRSRSREATACPGPSCS